MLFWPGNSCCGSWWACMLYQCMYTTRPGICFESMPCTIVHRPPVARIPLSVGYPAAVFPVSRPCGLLLIPWIPHACRIRAVFLISFARGYPLPAAAFHHTVDKSPVVHAIPISLFPACFYLHTMPGFCHVLPPIWSTWYIPPFQT